MCGHAADSWHCVLWTLCLHAASVLCITALQVHPPWYHHRHQAWDVSSRMEMEHGMWEMGTFMGVGHET